jgi:hypothetical protein
MPTTVQPAPPDQQPAFTPSLSQEVSPISNPWDEDQGFKDLMEAKIFSCPGSNAGDYAFLAWLYDFYQASSGGAAPAAAPTVTALNPNTAPANADVTVAITGTGFDASAKVMVGPTEVSPTGTPTPTDLSVLIPAADISIPGAVDISVKNGDGQTSNVISLTLT